MQRLSTHKSSYALFRAVTAISALTLAIPLCAAQSSQVVSVKSGRSVTVKGSIKGRAYKDFLVTLGAGQSAAVSLQSKSASVYFNFNPPKSDASMFIGSTSGNRLETRQVPVEGNYIIRVYQMGAAKSEGKSATFSLKISVSGKSLKPLPGAVDAKLKGTPYHASGPVPCKIALQPEVKECTAYVIRRGGGTATVEFRVGSMKRLVLFVDGVPRAHDSSEKLRHTRKEDMTTLKFGDDPSEQYTIADALIYGG